MRTKNGTNEVLLSTMNEQVALFLVRLNKMGIGLLFQYIERLYRSLKLFFFRFSSATKKTPIVGCHGLVPTIAGSSFCWGSAAAFVSIKGHVCGASFWSGE